MATSPTMPDVSSRTSVQRAVLPLHSRRPRRLTSVGPFVGEFVMFIARMHYIPWSSPGLSVQCAPRL
eukprot:3607601-Pyramimonas_sp.AAC.1